MTPIKHIGVYFSRAGKLGQMMKAIVYLRHEVEISIDSLLAYLTRSISYLFELCRVFHNIKHLRHKGLVSINWGLKIIKQEKSMKHYVIKQEVNRAFWPKISNLIRKSFTKYIFGYEITFKYKIGFGP